MPKDRPSGLKTAKNELQSPEELAVVGIRQVFFKVENSYCLQFSQEC